MLELEMLYEDGRGDQGVFRLPVAIGRDPGCSIRLKSWRVARQHARIEARGNVLFLEDLGSIAGTFLNGNRVSEAPLSVGDEIIVGPCRMHLLRLPAIPVITARQNGSEELTTTSMQEMPPCAVDRTHTEESGDIGDIGDANSAELFTYHRRRLHKALVEALDLRRRDIMALSDEALRQEAANVLASLITADIQLPASLDRSAILQEVVDEAVGLGPLEPLLADPAVSEIMVNAHEEIYVERAGRLVRHGSAFSSEQAVVAIIDRIVAPLGRRIDESSPMVDARLKDGSRVNAVIPPLALRGACLTIRKFPERRLEMDDLLKVGSLDHPMAAFLGKCVKSRKSLLVSGGTGSGKTTLLNVLSNCIPATERVITIEDAAELRLNHSHLVSLESRPPNVEGKGKVDIRDLVRNALRMRPDRIIVGECRGAEALDMLSAMNTGHEGSLTTLHANSPRDALARLETMILMAGMDLPLAAIREHIASAVDVIVQQSRLADGRRLITAIVEITGMEAGRIQSQVLFRYRSEPHPQFEGCGIQPECFSTRGEVIPMEWLNQTTRVDTEVAQSWRS